MPDDEQPDLSAFAGLPESGRTSASDDADAVTSPESDDADAGSDPADPEHAGASGDRPQLADLDREERVALGVDLLAHLERESLPLSEAVDRIETVTTSPALTREILDTAELRGVIDREDGRIRTRRGGTFVRFDEQVIRREGDYECRRCGAGLETGHFVRLASGELGPFGPECVRAVLGRT